MKENTYTSAQNTNKLSCIGMIDLSPDSGEFYWMDEDISFTEPARYNVIFFEKVIVSLVFLYNNLFKHFFDNSTVYGKWN